MTKAQESIAEIIIQMHKDKHGLYDWQTINADDYDIVFNLSQLAPAEIQQNFSKKYRYVELVKKALMEEGLLDFFNLYQEETRLTQKGWSIYSYEKYKLELAEDERNQREKDITDFELAKRTLRNYPWTQFAAWAGLIIAACVAMLELIQFLSSSQHR